MHDSLYKSEKNNSFNLFLTLISIILIITPYFNRNFPVSIWSGIIALWYINVFFRKGGKYTFEINSFILVLWFLWCFTLRIVGLSSAAWGNYFLLFCSIDVIIKALYIKNNYNDREKKILLRCLIICLLTTLLMNLLIWIKDSSEFENFNFFVDKYQKTNKIQSAQFYNMYSFLIGDSLYLYLTEHKKKYRILDLTIIIVTGIFLLLVNPRMNSIIITLILCLSTIFFIKPGAERKIGLLILLLAISVALLLLFKEQILNTVSPRLKPRIESLYYMLSGKDYDVEGSSMSRRIELQLISLRTFVSSPKNFILGAGLHLGSENYRIIGQHGFITDYLAAYGLIGLSFLLFLFKRLFNDYKCMYHNKETRTFMNCILTTFFLASLICNSFCKEVCVSAFLIPVLFIEKNQND